MDQEGKIPRAVGELGPVEGRDVVLLDADRGVRAAQIEALGGRVRKITGLEMSDVPSASADVLVSYWSAFRGPAAETAQQLREAERVVKPNGRLLVVHDYDRDDAAAVMWDERHQRDLITWSRLDGPFLRRGFKVRVLHCWWQFASLEEAAEVLRAAFGARGEAVAARLRRPRLSHKVCVYHRPFEGPGAR